MCHAVSLTGTAGVVAVAVLSLLPDANAFAPNAQPAFSSKPLYGELERVKSAGGGTDVAFPVGDFRLFDPEAEGKLQGTGSLSQRIQAGADYVLPPTFPDGTYLAAGGGINGAAGVESSPPEGAVAMDAQHWLEHLDDNLPVNFAKPNAPVTATLLARQVSLFCNMICCAVTASHMSPVTYSFKNYLSYPTIANIHSLITTQRIITPDAPGDIQHIILRLPEGMHYVEGQSLSVIPPGTDPANGRPHKPRLYSIASTRYGDVLDGNTVSLCVRRAEYYDPNTGVADPTKKGVCSNFLCDAAPGTAMSVAGPVGKTMLLPKDPNADVIMIATGTGIAPFRAFLHRLFMENTVARHMFGGTAWLLLGVPTSGGLLYKEEIDAMMQNGE